MGHFLTKERKIDFFQFYRLSEQNASQNSTGGLGHLPTYTNENSCQGFPEDVRKQMN